MNTLLEVEMETDCFDNIETEHRSLQCKEEHGSRGSETQPRLCMTFCYGKKGLECMMRFGTRIISFCLSQPRGSRGKITERTEYSLLTLDHTARGHSKLAKFGQVSR